MCKFELGQLLATRGIADRMDKDRDFCSFVSASLNRYVKCDWGDTCKDDSKQNDLAVQDGDNRILAVYQFTNTGETIWIITEWDRSATTVLFPSEY